MGGKVRREVDLLGEVELPHNALHGVHTATESRYEAAIAPSEVTRIGATPEES